MSKYKLTIHATSANFENLCEMTSVLLKTTFSFRFSFWCDKLIVKNIPSIEDAEELARVLHSTQKHSRAGFSVNIKRQLF